MPLRNSKLASEHYLRFTTYPFQTSDFKILKMKMWKKYFDWFANFDRWKHVFYQNKCSNHRNEVLFKHLTDFVAEEERSENIFSKKFSFVVQKWLKSGKVELKNFSNSHAELFVRWFCFSPELQILSSNFQCKNFFQLIFPIEIQNKRVPPPKSTPIWGGYSPKL